MALGSRLSWLARGCGREVLGFYRVVRDPDELRCGARLAVVERVPHGARLSAGDALRGEGTMKLDLTEQETKAVVLAIRSYLDGQETADKWTRAMHRVLRKIGAEP